MDTVHFSRLQGGDLFGGLNDGLLSRAEALAAVDIGKHQSSNASGPGGTLPQLKHDMMYHHHGMGGPPPPNSRPHQVNIFLFLFLYFMWNVIHYSLKGNGVSKCEFSCHSAGIDCRGECKGKVYPLEVRHRHRQERAWPV
ncbi:hypothetical protein O3M35_002074 [Rhynocoris fuscipes]|uniref:Uncharacterized protein n=1 Tax=Rhynocoris fuscipes TaxID=488301 RepID=A0AAW1CXU7_9HEMI